MYAVAFIIALLNKAIAAEECDATKASLIFFSTAQQNYKILLAHKKLSVINHRNFYQSFL